MTTSIIYSKTAKGITELRNGAKSLSKEQGKALTLVDGKSAVTDLLHEFEGSEQQKIIGVLADLEKLGLIRVFSQMDAAPAATPFPSLPSLEMPIERRHSASELPVIEVTELAGGESVQAWAEAKRGASDLQEKGFYSYAKKPSSGVPIPADSLTALVVEDDEAIAELLEMLLTNRGFSVRKAADIPEAVASLKNPVLPDFVLLDVVLPGSTGHDGFHILKLIRQTPAMSKLPVIMVTSQISDEQVMRGLKAGADGYIFKPFKWDTLYSCIKGVLGI